MVAKFHRALLAGAVAVTWMACTATPSRADASSVYTDSHHQNCNAAAIVAPSGNPWPGDGVTGAGAMAECIIAAKEDEDITRAAREQFVQHLLDVTDWATGGWYNVMIFDVAGDDAFGDPTYKHPYAQSLQNIDFQYDITYNDQTSRQDQTYRIFIFHGGGTFENPGDGGWINWGFSGNFSRRTAPTTIGADGYDSYYVDFSPTYTPGVTKPGSPATPAGSAGTVPTYPNPGIPVGPAAPASTGGTITAPGSTGTTVPGTSNPGVPITGFLPALPTNVPVHIKTAHGLGAVATTSVNGANVIAANLGSPGALWTFVPTATAGRFKISNGLGQVLTENTHTWLANSALWTSSSYQQWQVLGNTNQTFQIRITNQDCLTYDEDQKALGVWTCDGSAAQQFTVTQ